MNQRRISAKHVSVVATLMFFFPVSRAAVPDEPWTGELNELTSRLVLADRQVPEVRRLLKMIDGQARTDRQRCADDPRALIPAAEQREQMKDRYLESILEPEQIERYGEIKEQRKRDWEFQYLREGLRLSFEQCVTVRAILDEYGRKRKALSEEMKSRGDGPGARKNGDRGSGRMGGGGTGFGTGREGGMGGGMNDRGDMGPGGDMHGDAGQIFNEQGKRIKEILTPIQKKMFRDVQKMMEQKRESIRETFGPPRQRRKMEPDQ